MSSELQPVKPRLRGYLHQEAFFITVGASALLIAKSTNRVTFLASCIYSLGLLLLFGISALYHRPFWTASRRALFKKLDHSAIYILIAGTFTPICLLSLSVESGHRLLIIIWIAAAVGILQSIFWAKAPKYMTALFYIVMGWQALPFLEELNRSFGFNNLILLILGGFFYTVGAIFYALKKPNFYPSTFGYHELFHLFTIIAALLHFIIIYQLIS